MNIISQTPDAAAAVNQPPAIFLMGPTASGKTGLAVHLVQHFNAEIISVDSALVFRDMNIGTAKPDADTLQQAPHHLIDVISPLDYYSAAQFRTDALALMADIVARGKVPLLVGGTMLYFQALQHGLADLPSADPELRTRLVAEAAELGWPALHQRLATLDPITAARLEPTDAQRIERALQVCLQTGQPMSRLLETATTQSLPYRLIKIALEPSDRSQLHQRIALRFQMMLDQGFLDEVRQLQRRYPQLQPTLPSMRCVGYRQAWDHLAGLSSSALFLEQSLAATRQLAKRQLTWLRSMDDVLRFDCLADDLIGQVETALLQDNWLAPRKY
jgi:tRNA dimethylallyltransferase